MSFVLNYVNHMLLLCLNYTYTHKQTNPNPLTLASSSYLFGHISIISSINEPLSRILGLTFLLLWDRVVDIINVQNTYLFIFL